jgi:hypothetical protein
MELEQQTEVEVSGKPERAGPHAAKQTITRERRNGEGAASALASLKLERARAEPNQVEEWPPA